MNFVRKIKKFTVIQNYSLHSLIVPVAIRLVPAHGVVAREDLPVAPRDHDALVSAPTSPGPSSLRGEGARAPRELRVNLGGE